LLRQGAIVHAQVLHGQALLATRRQGDRIDFDDLGPASTRVFLATARAIDSSGNTYCSAARQLAFNVLECRASKAAKGAPLAPLP
jgi:hypothetical protein